MRILFTGSSSFTGLWFVRALHDAGHEVHAIFTRANEEAYGDDARIERVQLLNGCCERIFDCSFGDESFLQLIADRGPWDVLCHHAADVRDYRSPDFDVARAVSTNTHQLPRVLEALRDNGCRRIVLTGSVFEGGEGAGSESLPDFSPYGLSKRLTAEMVRYYCRASDISLGKFVIPNPFGPHEEPRFTAYLMRTWFAGDAAHVRTPAYVRDNIHVSLLARHYARFVEQIDTGGMMARTNPSGIVASQGVFAERFAEAMRQRLDLPCELVLENQTEFTEPRVRINTDVIDGSELGWSEREAWDQVAAYYAERLSRTEAVN